MTTHDDASIPAAQVLLAGPDTIHLSLDIEISDEPRAKLETEKAVAQEADTINAVHCPEWLVGAQVLPHGARGGYGLLLETENYSIKILGAGIPNRPGLFIELRSHFLHTHPDVASYTRYDPTRQRRIIMVHQIVVTDQDYAALTDMSARTGTPIEQLVHQAISQKFAASPLEQSESIRYPDGEQLTPEEREEMERIAQEIGGEKPWLSDMVLEDRGPR